VKKNGVPVTETKGILELLQGDVLELAVPGGGGFGPPAARDPELVRRDLDNGIVSAEAAADHYGYREAT
jgi:N-methylhydantoinase B